MQNGGKQTADKSASNPTDGQQDGANNPPSNSPNAFDGVKTETARDGARNGAQKPNAPDEPSTYNPAADMLERHEQLVNKVKAGKRM